MIYRVRNPLNGNKWFVRATGERHAISLIMSGADRLGASSERPPRNVDENRILDVRPVVTVTGEFDGVLVDGPRRRYEYDLNIKDWVLR